MFKSTFNIFSRSMLQELMQTSTTPEMSKIDLEEQFFSLPRKINRVPKRQTLLRKFWFISMLVWFLYLLSTKMVCRKQTRRKRLCNVEKRWQKLNFSITTSCVGLCVGEELHFCHFFCSVVELLLGLLDPVK